jgi:hypothetical protein
MAGSDSRMYVNVVNFLEHISSWTAVLGPTIWHARGLRQGDTWSRSSTMVWFFLDQRMLVYADDLIFFLY